MRLIDLRRLSGPNIYTSRPVTVARLELDGLTGQETSDYPGFADRLTAVLPRVAEHHCAAGAGVCGLQPNRPKTIPPSASARPICDRMAVPHELHRGQATTAGRPVAFGENWLTPDAATLSATDIQGMSTAAVHRLMLHHPIASSTNAISAESAGATVARRLDIGARSAVLVLTRTRFDAQGRVREHNRFTVDPSAYEFTFSTKGDVAAAAVLQAVAA